jgi:hypothetical protein
MLSRNAMRITAIVVVALLVMGAAATLIGELA